MPRDESRTHALMTRFDGLAWHVFLNSPLLLLSHHIRPLSDQVSPHVCAMPLRTMIRPGVLLRCRPVAYPPDFLCRSPRQTILPSIGARPLSTPSLPIILQPSFWRSLTPKALRGHTTETEDHQAKSIGQKTKEWNPATFFIVIFILIGSQGIQLISLQRSFDLFSNETEAKLTALREVVKRIQRGEDVDVKDMLGTGDETREREWEDVIRELEEEDKRLHQTRQRRKAKQAANLAEERTADSKSP